MTKINLIAEPGKQEIFITRVFDAPRDLVFKTYTDPQLIPQWWSPKIYTTVVDTMEVRPGGIWRFVQRDADGNPYAFHGVYHTVAPSEQLIYTFEFEGMPGHVMLDTITFEDQNGKTKLTEQAVFQSVGDRDGMLATGMEEGSAQTMDRFADLLIRFVKV